VRRDQPTTRIYGPYEHGRRWRVTLRSDGASRHRSFATRVEADAYIAEAEGQTRVEVSVSAAVELYAKSLADRGLRHATRARAENHLHRLLRTAEHGKRRLSWLARHGQQLYDASQINAAVDTHRNALAAGKAFGAWLVKGGMLRANPFAAVEGVGRRRRGKPQLTVDESRKLIAGLMSRWTTDPRPEYAATIAALLLGARATEVVVRDVRDLDDGGRLLWIPDSKTEAGKRCLEVPEVLRPVLLELARDRIGPVPLFRMRDGARATRWWLYHHARRLTGELAGRQVTPHGLRGTHASLARSAGATGEVVAAQLGHASVGMQVGTYARTDAIAAGQGAAALRVLRGGGR
jgi:integrase